MKKLQSTTSLITEIAPELGYQVSIIDSNESGDVLLISNGKKQCIVDNGQFGYYPTNLRWQCTLMKDKITTQKLLKKEGFKTLDSLFFRTIDFSSYTQLAKKVQKMKWAFPVLVKPARGLGGQNITIVKTKKELTELTKAFYQNKIDFMIQKIVNHAEHRIFIAHGEVMVLHSKNYKYIRSDGKRAIQKQLERIHPANKSDAFIETYLKQQNWTLKSIPPKNTKICYHLTKDNTRDFIQTEKIPKNIRKWAKRLHTSINTNIVGIDLFTPHGLGDPDSFIIIELNANPSLRDYAQTYKNRNLSKKILKNELNNYFKR